MKNSNLKTAPVAAYSGRIPNTPLRFLAYLSTRYKFLGVVTFALILTAEILNLSIFYVSAKLVDNFTLATDLATQKEVLIFWGGLFVAVSAGRMLAYRISGFVAVRWIIDFHKDGYNVLYDYLTKHSHNYFSNRFAGALSNKISNAVDSAAGIMHQILWTFFAEFVGLVITLGIFFTIDVRIGLSLLLALLLVLVFNIYAVNKRRPLVVDYSVASSKARGEGVDSITNIAAVRQYVQRQHELQRLSVAFEDRAEKDTRQAFLGEWIMVVNNILAISMTALVIFLIIILLDNKSVTAGEMVMVLGLLGRVGYMFIVIGQSLNRFVNEYGRVEEGLKEILIEHEIVDVENATELIAEKGEIVWDSVTFEYGSNKVFDNFNLNIKPGQRVGLVGPSGAGKTTFVSLLLRQHEVSQGQILIDNQNIATSTQDSLRSAISVVPQEPMLFHRSIKENIAYGNPYATEAEIIEVAKKAQAHDFIASLPEGYDTLVGERGVKLSGGQKQRVAIARAMLKDSPILVLDEATSALDSESEVAIQEALHVLMEGKTVIAIAHRLSTLRKMDRILVLESGKIVEDGKHDVLAKAGGTYQRLWEHQAGGFVGE